MLQIVLISEKIRDKVRIPLDSSFDICIEKETIEKILKLLSQNTGKRIKILLFLALEDLFSVTEVLKELDSKKLIYSIIVFSKKGGVKNPSSFLYVAGFRTTSITKFEFEFLAEKAFSNMDSRLLKMEQKNQDMISLTDALNDQEALIRIGKSLSLEKDPDKLLRTILYLSKKITGADAGSIFLIQEDGNGNKVLSFKYSHTFSMNLSYEEFTMPLDTNSLAGYVGVTGKILNIPDVYHLDENDPVSFNRSYDKTSGYRTKSMLIVPMRGNLDTIIGVIQLINSKEGNTNYSGNEAYEELLKTPEDFNTKVVPFKTRYESLMEAVAGQAAIALENNRMLRQIEYQFEEFVKASVTAIESRDPATSGHSFRVAAMCVNMAKAINKKNDGIFADLKFSDIQLKEIEFAGLLHDFGKVYIDPSIFLKGKKLFEWDFDYFKMRMKFLYRSLELKYANLEKEIMKKSAGNNAEALDKLYKEKEKLLKQFGDLISRIKKLNEPSVYVKNPEEAIDEILNSWEEYSCCDFDGEIIPLLNNKEIMNLKIKKGSLNNEERKIIQSHVEYTYKFVSTLPWPDEYKNIPEITQKHHEKLDGSGYPWGIKGKKDFPVQSRMMVIADIFDALAASDRPYKKAISMDKVFSILKEEADQGKIDSDLFALFIEGKCWESLKKPDET